MLLTLRPPPERQSRRATGWRFLQNRLLQMLLTLRPPPERQSRRATGWRFLQNRAARKLSAAYTPNLELPGYRLLQKYEQKIRPPVLRYGTGGRYF